MDLSWMAWTQPTAIFFTVIASLLFTMSIWEYFSPGGGPRLGILRFETTRGDRFFVSLLGSGFICMAWLTLVGLNLWWGLAACVVYTFLVFRFV
jgi:predicted small integral membrane protein